MSIDGFYLLQKANSSIKIRVSNEKIVVAKLFVNEKDNMELGYIMGIRGVLSSSCDGNYKEVILATQLRNIIFPLFELDYVSANGLMFAGFSKVS